MPPKEKTQKTPPAAEPGPADMVAPPEVTGPVAQAAASRATAAADPRMVESLLNERRGYITRGMADRAAAVDEQIRFYGGEPPAED